MRSFWPMRTSSIRSIWGGAPSPPSHSGRRLCTLKENDEAHVAYVLSRTRGDRKEAARILGVTLRQLQRKIASMRGDPRWAGMLDGETDLS
jgi:DNA-binding NtrC family response regulator